MANKEKDTGRRVGVTKVRIWLSDDQTKLFISYGGHADLTVELGTTQVDEMLAAVAQWRAKMYPAIPDSYDQKIHLTAEKNPQWYTEPEMSMGGSLLHLRHPAFGWLSSWLPRPEAAKLAKFLQAQDEAQEKASAHE
jgi:hypothetical protein